MLIALTLLFLSLTQTPDPVSQTPSAPSSSNPSTVTSEEESDSITLDVLPDSPQATKRQVKGDTLPVGGLLPPLYHHHGNCMCIAV